MDSPLPTNRITNSLNGEADAHAPTADPHALVPVPTWFRVAIVAESGTRFRVIDHHNGTLSVFVREGLALDWPHGTPEVAGTDGTEVKVQLGQNAVFLASNQARVVDHQFQPSALDPSVCQVCARPSRQRWRLEYFRNVGDRLERQLAWFDDHSEALEERGRLANQPEVLALTLQLAVYREGSADAE